jgi:mono/diheme cytochrome c family protein
MTGPVRSRLIALFLVTLGCNEAPADRREWRAGDHDHTDTPNANQVVGGQDGGTPAELARHGLNELTMVAWQQHCVRCHGSLGRGDGPQGPMTRAIDLGNPDFQRTVSDEQILKSLKDGKGLMPASTLPEPTLKSLVQLVRLIGRATVDAAAVASGMPAGSGDPHGRVAPHGSGKPAPSARPGSSSPRPVTASSPRTVTSGGPAPVATGAATPPTTP